MTFQTVFFGRIDPCTLWRETRATKPLRIPVGNVIPCVLYGPWQRELLGGSLCRTYTMACHGAWQELHGDYEGITGPAGGVVVI